MSEIALLADPHWGVRNHSPLFQDYFERFVVDVFFPTLLERQIKTLIILGDLFDNRKVINLSVLNRTRKVFLDPLDDHRIETYCLVGNHDAYFREAVSVNAVTELAARYPRFHAVDLPKEVTIHGLQMLLLPWIAKENYDICTQAITDSTAPVLMAHLELTGFPMYRGSICDHGMSKDLFRSFQKVFSGHFHTQSRDGNIHYLGSAAEHTFQDAGETKGFHLLNTRTLETTFVENPYRLHHHLVYDDREGHSRERYLNEDLTDYTSCFLKVHVTHKTTPAIFERWLDRLQSINPSSISVLEDFSLTPEMSNPEESGGASLSKEQGTGTPSIIGETTTDVMDCYVDDIPNLDIDPAKLKALLRDLYTEAVNSHDSAD